MDAMIECMSRLLNIDPGNVQKQFKIVYTDDNEREVMIVDDNSYQAALFLCNSNKLSVNLVPIEREQ